MNNLDQYTKPSGEFCFGREDFCSELIPLAFQRRSLLLFGGRQSGKTTTLLRVRDLMKLDVANISELNSIDVPVYIDLMRLPFDATPNDFWGMLAMQAYKACVEQILGFGSEANFINLGTKPIDFDMFTALITSIIQGGKNVEIRLLFLVDEAKRIIGKRFPRGFLDNIFSLLYGGDSIPGSRIAIVFTGAQDLYIFSEDDTSPIASRAASRLISPLTEKNVIDIVGHLTRKVPEKEDSYDLNIIGKWVHSWTGGHAGLSVRFAQHILSREKKYITLDTDYAQRILQDNINLFRVWADSLSLEAKSIQELMIREEAADVRRIVSWLTEKGFDGYKTDKAIEELVFMNLIKTNKGKISPINNVYWNYIKEYLITDTDDVVNGSTKYVWNLIEQVELSLRDLLRSKFIKEWGNQWENKIKSSLSIDESEKVERMQGNSAKSYPLSPRNNSPDILEMLYLGQLINLILSKNTWSFFKHMFRDKRYLQDLVSSISPVRNDRAHFRQVPPKELDRCRIACDDLLVIVEREEHIVVTNGKEP
jgi:hypothetical protein